jgi:aspartyl-tRNA(Asn)/glutamyl-tRNA(Gln) amidotransferase subunit C
MAIDQTTVENIAELAQLNLEESQVPEHIAKMSRILELVDQMQDVDTSGVAPLAHPFDSVQRLRPDEVTEQNDREKLQQVAPRVQDGLYLVPRVVE